MTAIRRFQPVATGRNRPILLKKTATVSTTEKYELEINIFTLSIGLWGQISRSDAQKGPSALLRQAFSPAPRITRVTRPYPIRLTATTSLRAIRLDQPQQTTPGHHLIHFGKEALTAGLLALASVFKVGKAHLADAWLGSDSEGVFQHI